MGSGPCTLILGAVLSDPQVHEKIRENPMHTKKERKNPGDGKIWQPKKITYEERKERLKAKLATLMEAGDE